MSVADPISRQRRRRRVRRLLRVEHREGEVGELKSAAIEELELELELTSGGALCCGGPWMVRV